MEKEFDYAALMGEVRRLADKYAFLQFSYLTESEGGRAIPILSLGEGKKQIYYVGAHHGAERITAALLMKFASEFCDFLASGVWIFGINLEYVLQTRTIRIIPMLNPDGVEISANGVPKDSLWYARLIAINKESNDFTNWQANARGVDLNHNYDSGFYEYKALEREMGISEMAPTRFSGPYPESEPEVASLCRFIRLNPGIRAVLTLHSQGEEIYYTSRGKCPDKSERAVHLMSLFSSYKASIPSGAAAHGGLTDWVIDELGIPSFTVECGKGQNPLPISECANIYSRLRRVFFTLPYLCT